MAEKKNVYTIKFTGLKLGIHHFRFEMNNKFFESFEFSEIDTAKIVADVELEKMNNMMVMNFDLSGYIDTLCDRCQDPIKAPISFKERMVVKFGEESGSTEDEVMAIGPADIQLNLDQYLYEYVHFAIPSKNVHENVSDCNEDIIKRLYEDIDTEDTESDPRWDQLKDLND